MTMTPELTTTILTIAANGLLFSLGKLSTLVIAANDNSTVLTEHTLIPVGIAIACTAGIMASVWKAASTLQNLTDRIGVLEREIREVKDNCQACNGDGLGHKGN